MTALSNLADDISGLLSVALVFKGVTPSKNAVSIAWLKDGDREEIVDLSGGLPSSGDNFTPPMLSYLSGLNEVGDYLKGRKTTDEDGVTEDDIEKGALLLAFPKVAQDAGAMSTLKSHLDALQEHGVLAKLEFNGRPRSAENGTRAQTTDSETSTTEPSQSAGRAEEPERKRTGLFGGART